MISNQYVNDSSNEALPEVILRQRKEFTSIDKTKIQSPEKLVQNVSEIFAATGKYVLNVNDYDFHVFFNKCKRSSSSQVKKLYVFFFAARSFERKDGKEIFRALPFYPRWSYSQFLDGDVLCIEDPMYYKYNDLHIGWMFGSPEFNLLDAAKDFIGKSIKTGGYDIENVYLVGSSCGGYAALQIGAKLSGCKVIAINPQIYIQNYSYYFQKFCNKLNITQAHIDDDRYGRFSTEKLLRESKSTFVIAANLLSKEDYNDQILRLNEHYNLKLNYGVNQKDNVKIWLYLAESANPHSTMEDNNLIYALINLCTDNLPPPLYTIFSDIWAKNFELQSKINAKPKVETVTIKAEKVEVKPPRNFKTELRCGQNHDQEKLLVVCSHKDSFAFYKYDFGFNTLFISDSQNTYFTLYAGRLTDYIKSIVLQKGIKKVCFLGCSKGGFAAILLASLLSKYCPEIEVRFASFSPQTRIYPKNENLYFPSYAQLLSRSESDAAIKTCMQQYGDLPGLLNRKNLQGDIYYSEFNEPDYIEQHRIKSVNVIKHPLPFSFHGAISAFVTNTKDGAAVEGLVNSIYRNAGREIDLGASLPKDPQTLVQEIKNARIPTLRKLVFDIFYEN